MPTLLQVNPVGSPGRMPNSRFRGAPATAVPRVRDARDHGRPDESLANSPSRLQGPPPVRSRGCIWEIVGDPPPASDTQAPEAHNCSREAHAGKSILQRNHRGLAQAGSDHCLLGPWSELRRPHSVDQRRLPLLLPLPPRNRAGLADQLGRLLGHVGGARRRRWGSAASRRRRSVWRQVSGRRLRPPDSLRGTLDG